MMFNKVKVIKRGCFYKKETLLYRTDKNMFAPKDYPKNCYFLTEKLIYSLPKIFKIIE
jgi:hypothetical protein